MVAPGVGVLGAVPALVSATRWDFVSGTSAATAYTSGAAALLLARHDWPASVVRSALATSAAPVGTANPVLRGRRRVRAGPRGLAGVAYVVPTGDYRAWLSGRLAHGRLNTPSLLLDDDQARATRTITNVGRRAMYFSSTARGFTRHDVSVTPAAVRLGRARARRSRSGSAGPRPCSRRTTAG